MIIQALCCLLILLPAKSTAGAVDSVSLERILDGAEQAERAFREKVQDYTCRARTTISEPQNDGADKTVRVIEKTIYRKLPDRRMETFHSIIEDGRALSPEEAAEHQKKQNRSVTRVSRDFFSPEHRRRYTYELLEPDTIDGVPAHVLNISPREEEQPLVSGTIWLRGDNFEIIRMDIQPVKRPRFVKKLHMILAFDEVSEGIWLPVRIDVDACGGFLFLKKCLNVHETWDSFRINPGLPDSIFVTPEPWKRSPGFFVSLLRMERKDRRHAQTHPYALRCGTTGHPPDLCSARHPDPRPARTGRLLGGDRPGGDLEPGSPGQ